MDFLTPLDLQSFFNTLISKCPLWTGQDVYIYIIANPKAGGFTQKRISEKNKVLFLNALGRIKDNPDIVKISNIQVQETTEEVEGSVFAKTILDKVLSEETKKNTQYIIITAGGDGTSLEVQTPFAEAALVNSTVKEKIRNHLTFIRLPLGTGNDGSDGRTLEDTLCRLIEPSHFAYQRVVKVTCGRGEDVSTKKRKIRKYGSLGSESPWYAFNIASIGIDAYITHMTNKTKGVLPGNFYKTWIDLACVFYDFQFPAKPFNISIYDKNDELIGQHNQGISFALLGASGYRTYGSGQKILPDNRSVCITQAMSIFTKLQLKKKFVTGMHTASSKAFFADGTKLVINSDQYILVQMDGEVHLVNPCQYPLIMEQTDPIIKIIECDNAPIKKGIVTL